MKEGIEQISFSPTEPQLKGNLDGLGQGYYKIDINIPKASNPVDVYIGLTYLLDGTGYDFQFKCESTTLFAISNPKSTTKEDVFELFETAKNNLGEFIGERYEDRDGKPFEISPITMDLIIHDVMNLLNALHRI